MSDPLRVPRDAALQLARSARDTSVRDIKATADTALGRAEEALAAASTQEEIVRVRDVFIISISNLGSTCFVTRSR